MTGSPSLCIVDANVLIDLHLGGVLRELFCLPFTFAAPDVIFAELQTPDGATLARLGLRSLEASGQEVRQVAFLAAQQRRISANDLFAFVLARARKAILVTGDSNLRRLATVEEMTVHGTLWVLDELLQSAFITRDEAALALTKMINGGSRLPPDECQRRLKRWRG